MGKKNDSTILAAVRETAAGLHRAGVLDQSGWKSIDRLSRPPLETSKSKPVRRRSIGQTTTK